MMCIARANREAIQKVPRLKIRKEKPIMRKTTTEKITGIQTQIQQLENQRKRLVKQHNEEERKKRTHRICKRGGLIESLLPETIPLTDEQFKAFIEKTLLSGFARKTLDGLTAQSCTTADNSVAVPS